jgi:outer membrane protein assembly factor BamB
MQVHCLILHHYIKIMNTRNVSVAGILMVVAILFSCEHGEEVTQGRVIVNNSSFDGRVDYDVDSTVIIGPLEGGRSKAAASLKLRAEVLPPVYNGITLRASHIYVDKDYAYVVYNLEGEPYLGGVEVFNIKDIKRPFIESQAIFVNTDVSSVYYDNNAIYLAEATGDEGFESPAVLEELQVESGKLTTRSRRVGLTSYAATDVSASQDNIVVTSGSTGGLFILDRTTLEKKAFVDLDDARAVAFGSGNSIVVMQGTPARVSLYNADGSLQNKFSLEGATIPESKSMLALKGNAIFVSAGDGGTYCINRTTGNVNFNIPTPQVKDLDPLLSVCNSVAVSGDMLYMANGEAGLYAATVHGEGERYSDLSPIRFSGKTSANHISAKGRTIFLATGTGGLKIVEIE